MILPIDEHCRLRIGLRNSPRRGFGGGKEEVHGFGPVFAAEPVRKGGTAGRLSREIQMRSITWAFALKTETVLNKARQMP